MNKLLSFTDRGIYCEQADVYIDPWKPVSRALITHGHSDHSRAGHKSYLATQNSVPIIRHRLGKINIEGIKYGEVKTINGVKISFHPAGHIIGSAQIKLEYKGEIWVVSGDYKIEYDGISEAFEPVRCHHFITECTFGLPVYKWVAQSKIFEEINNWWRQNKEEGKVSLITAYSLGKAQRIMQNVDLSIGEIYAHGAIVNMNKAIRNAGTSLVPTLKVDDKMKPADFAGQLVLAPPSSANSAWSKRFKNVSLAVASGWMALRGARRRRAADRGFVLSDHADWDGLLYAIKETGAEHIYPTHGYTRIFTQWLNENGYTAKVVETEFEGETLDAVPT